MLVSCKTCISLVMYLSVKTPFVHQGRWKVEVPERMVSVRIA